MKRKIAILAPYVGVVNRGAETFVIELSKKLSEEYCIDIYSTGITKELQQQITVIDVSKPKWFQLHESLFIKSGLYRKFCNVIYWIHPENIFERKFTQKVFENHIERNSYDIIFPNNGVWGAIYAHKLRTKLGTPFIYTGHGGIGKGERRVLQQHPDCYIALSYKHEEWARKFSDNVKRISNGINCRDFTATKTALPSTDKKMVLVVGALTKFKQHKLAIDAVALLPDFCLAILGKGELYEELLQYGKRKLGNRFKIDSVPYAEIKQYYEKADVFTLPSHNEPFGIVYLEALSMGLPVVAPDDEVRREIVGNAGILCNCRDENEYADALQRAVSTNWGDKPRKQALKFDWEAIALQYKKVIGELI